MRGTILGVSRVLPFLFLKPFLKVNIVTLILELRILKYNLARNHVPSYWQSHGLDLRLSAELAT